jgi:hypothetical protein
VHSLLALELSSLDEPQPLSASAAKRMAMIDTLNFFDFTFIGTFPFPNIKQAGPGSH